LAIKLFNIRKNAKITLSIKKEIFLIDGIFFKVHSIKNMAYNEVIDDQNKSDPACPAHKAVILKNKGVS